MDVERRWNHNIEYHPLVLAEVRPGARTALDVGTGDGMLARDLAQQVPKVTGIDLDADVLSRAAASTPEVEWVQGDLLTHPFAESSFDVVASIAVLHHFADPAAALRRMAELVAPGGSLVVIGVARNSTPIDVVWDAAGVVKHRARSRTRAVWEHTAPTIWPPAQSFAEMRRMSRSTLPGARFRRLALWRYAIVWRADRA